MKFTILLTAFFLTISRPGFAVEPKPVRDSISKNLESISPATKEKVKKVIALSGARKSIEQGIVQMIALQKQTGGNSGLPEGFWDEMEKEFLGRISELEELLIPVYMNNFTDKEIDELIAFYESPVGRKMAAKQPAIMKESMEAGQAWGEKVSRELVERLQKAKG